MQPSDGEVLPGNSIEGSVIYIARIQLDRQPALQRQLKALSHHCQESGEQYIFQPRACFLHTFLWLLESDNLSYDLQ